MKLVDLSTARALQELGYDGEYTKTYSDFDTCIIDVTGLKIPTEIPLPRLDDAAYWLREKHGMYLQVTYGDLGDIDEWFYSIIRISDNTSLYCKIECFTTYEAALESAVSEAIKTIKNREQ